MKHMTKVKDMTDERYDQLRGKTLGVQKFIKGEAQELVKVGGEYWWDRMDPKRRQYIAKFTTVNKNFKIV